jgi:ABC-2 type transport system permease protein
MNKTLHLTLTLIKTSFDVGIGAKGKKSKPRRTIIVAGLLFGLFIASFSIPVTAFVVELVNNLKVINLPEIVFYMVLPLATITVTVLSIFTVVSILFLSTDNKILLYLPLTARQIIFARFMVVLVYTYLIEVIFLVPIFVGYGLALNLGFTFYIVSLIVTLTIPIIPLSLIVILLSYLLRYTNLSRYRDAFTYVAMALVLGLALGFNVFFSQAIRAIELDPLEILANVRSLLTVYGNVINQFLPYLTFALNGLVNNQVIEVLLNIGLLLLVNFIVLGLVVAFAGPVYLRTIMGSDERSKSRRKNSISKNISYSKNHFVSLIILEWKTMVRSPIYFLNLVFIVFLVPVLIIGSLVFGISSSGSANQIDILEIVQLLEALNYNFNNPFFVSILLGIALFFGSTTLIAPTAISRLGGSAPFFKSLPISYINFINFKTFWANILTIIPISLYILGVSLFGLLSIFDALVVIITITPLFILLNYLGLLIDLVNPKLDWLNEAQAVKQNLNGIFYMLGMWALTALVVYGGYLLSEASFVINGYIYAAIIFTLSVIGNVALLVYFKRRGYTLFKGVS